MSFRFKVQFVQRHLGMFLNVQEFVDHRSTSQRAEDIVSLYQYIIYNFTKIWTLLKRLLKFWMLRIQSAPQWGSIMHLKSIPGMVFISGCCVRLMEKRKKKVYRLDAHDIPQGKVEETWDNELSQNKNRALTEFLRNHVTQRKLFFLPFLWTSENTGSKF